MTIAYRALLGLGLVIFMGAAAAPDPFARLAMYNGEWDVRAAHPWSGAAPGAIDRLTSRCHRFSVYFACEQSVNGKPTALIVYAVGEAPDQLSTRTIAPNGLAGGRGLLTFAGSQWTYLDKPPATLKGNWSRTENHIVSRDRIRFEEYESADEGKTWTMTNSGEETRRR